MTVGRVLTRLGLAVVAAAIPPTVGAGAGIAVTTGSAVEAVTITLRAMQEPLVGGSGLPWLLHASTLALWCGCWLLGAGLLLGGLFD